MPYYIIYILKCIVELGLGMIIIQVNQVWIEKLVEQIRVGLGLNLVGTVHSIYLVENRINPFLRNPKPNRF